MKKVLLSVALIAASFTTFAQIGIGTTTPEGALDVVSTNSALILPRVANTAAVATPVNGMLVYDLSTNCFKGYQNGGWSDCGFAPSAAAVAASTSVLSQIGSQADSPDTENAVITAADLSNILPAITGVIAANQTAYQDYIDANPDAFSSPATQAEVQAMVDAVNAVASDAVLTQIGNEADNPDSVNSVVTVAQLGYILPALTGIESAHEASYQNYIDGNPDAFSSPATQAEVQAMVDAIGPQDVVSTTGKIWMDRNLGATQVAESSNDAAAYGDMYQWGRAADGHQLRTNTTTTSTLATTSTPGHGDFITSGTGDWLATQEVDLWQGVSGTNNPCPTGYRLPTATEFSNEVSSFGSLNLDGAYKSVLKLTATGSRSYGNGSINPPGGAGNYWSSTVSGDYSRSLGFSNISASVGTSNRGFGMSVRCIKN